MKQDETIPGGKYILNNVYVNCDGEYLGPIEVEPVVETVVEVPSK